MTHTALMLRGVDTRTAIETQVILFRGGRLFRRRAPQGDDKPRWSKGVHDLSELRDAVRRFVEGNDILVPPTVLELTDDEHTEGTTGTLVRNVQLRFHRVREAQEIATYSPVTEDWVLGFFDSWNTDTESDWALSHVHEKGTAREKTASKKVVKPASIFDYPPLVDDEKIKRPNDEWYWVREVHGQRDVDLYRTLREEGVNTFTMGVAGTGKTAGFEAAFGSHLVTAVGTESTVADDWYGQWVKDPLTNEWRYEKGPLLLAMEGDGTHGDVLLLDEIGKVSPRELPALYPLMDGRGWTRVPNNPDLGVVEAKPGFSIVASTNPNGIGVRMEEALLSRFGLHMEVTTDYALVERLGVDPSMVRTAANLDDRRRQNQLSWAPQHRELMTWWKMCTVTNWAIATGSLLNEAPHADRGEVAKALKKAVGFDVKGLTL